MEDNESSKKQTLPEIPHITTNIIPLSSILRKFAEFSFAELSHIVQIQPSDEAKKKKLLELIVYLRQEYVRLYVLTKWSKISANDFNKLIDILAWLREQTSYFTNLIWTTKSLNQSLLSAKLPNPDLITALEVLINKRPTLPTHNLIEFKISSQKILETLRNLNVILHVRLALVTEIPHDFRGYMISDGRITISTSNYEFQLSAIDEDSPFFMIDFKFKLENCEPSPKFLGVANEALRTGGFSQLHRILTNYTNTMLLYLIHNRLKRLKYVKHVYQPDKFYIVLYYWVGSFVFKNSYVEIGLNKENKIIYRWFKQGEYIKTFNEVDGVEDFLQQIYQNHISTVLEDIGDLQVGRAVLQINQLTGQFYFKNSTLFLNNFLRKLNGVDYKFIKNNLKNLKIDMKIDEISTILSVTGWIKNNTIKLTPQEYKKFPGNKVENELSSLNLRPVNFFSRKEWPSNWFLIICSETTINSFIANIRSISGQWSIESITSLEIESFDYKNSRIITDQVSKKIMSQLITKELRNATFKVVKDDTLIIRTDSFIDLPSCSNVLFLSFKSEPYTQNMFIKLKGKLHNKLSLEDFLIGPDGVFEISEVIEFNRPSVLGHIIAKLQKLVKLIELIDFLKLENLNLLDVKLEEIVFKYGDQICTLRNTLEIELPSTNPHNLCLASMKRFLSKRGVGKLFKYLQDSNKLLEKLDVLSKECTTHNNTASNPSQLRYQVISKNLNYFAISYYNDSSNLREVVNLDIEMKYKDGKFLYLLSYDRDFDLKNEFQIDSQFSKQLRASALPVGDGIICDESGITEVLDELHRRTMTKIESK